MSLLLQETEHKGVGVYSSTRLEPGTHVLEFTGTLMRLEEVPFPLRPEEDFFTQVGPRVFRGPTGGLDNYVNHSCDPNCKVVIEEYDASLVTIKAVGPGEELTWDYSTTSTDSPEIWALNCKCGAFNCRRRISGFQTLPPHTQGYYLLLEAVPTYVRDLVGV
jgi:SET domain-containing protein